MFTTTTTPTTAASTSVEDSHHSTFTLKPVTRPLKHVATSAVGALGDADLE
jgi:hypothetical protein